VSPVSQTAVLTRRNLLHVWTDPQQLIGMTIQPLMFLLLFVYVFGGAIAGSSRAYIQFVLPGLVVQGVGFWSAQTAIGLNADFQRGLIDRFRSLPIARSAVVAGRIVADVLRTAWGTVITVAAGLAFGFRPHASAAGAVAAFGLVLAWGFALSWLMAFLGVALRSAETVQTAGFLLIMPLGFASSVFAPASSMPGWLQAFVRANPVTVVTDAVRGLIGGGPAGRPLLESAAWLAGLTAVSWALTIQRYRARLFLPHSPPVGSRGPSPGDRMTRTDSTGSGPSAAYPCGTSLAHCAAWPAPISVSSPRRPTRARPLVTSMCSVTPGPWAGERWP